MGISQGQDDAAHGDVSGIRVVRSEPGEVDPQHSTEDRYAAAVGLQSSGAWCRPDRSAESE